MKSKHHFTSTKVKLMNIYVVSQAVEERMHTPRLLKAAGIPFTLVLDSHKQVQLARKMGYAFVASTETANLVVKRNAITKLAGSGWYIGMDDNVQYFTALPYSARNSLPYSARNSPNNIDTADGQNWRPIFNVECKPARYITLLEKLADEAQEQGAHYAGVATMENPFFRGKRYGLRRFVKSKIFCMNAAAGVRFKHRLCHDSYASAHAVALHGRVLVDNWMFYKAKWYEAGGLGTMQQRIDAGFEVQLEACIAEFPGLVGRAKGKNSALRFLLTSDAAVNRWRAAHGWLKE